MVEKGCIGSKWVNLVFERFSYFYLGFLVTEQQEKLEMLDELILILSVSRNQIHVIARMSKKGFSLRTSRTYCVKSVQIKSFFWPAFSSICSKYGDFLCNCPYSVQIQENTDQKKLHIWTLFTQGRITEDHIVGLITGNPECYC